MSWTRNPPDCRSPHVPYRNPPDCRSPHVPDSQSGGLRYRALLYGNRYGWLGIVVGVISPAINTGMARPSNSPAWKLPATSTH